MTEKWHDPEYIVSRSNLFWRSMYYDELEHHDGFEASFLAGADRLFYNAAHNVQSFDARTLKAIEKCFISRNIAPGIYVNADASPQTGAFLNGNGYHCAGQEDEHWYGYPVGRQQTPRPAPAARADTVEFTPLSDTAKLAQFLEINARVNQLPPGIAQKLQDRLSERSEGVDIRLFLAEANGKAVATLALGITGKISFIAEAATLPEYRRKGIYLALTDAAIRCARRTGCEAVYINCDKEAHSNEASLRYGFSRLFTRHYYLKRG